MAADPTPAAAVPSEWASVGPSVIRGGQARTRPAVAGRVPSLALSRFADVAYAGSANGGVWRSDDGGRSWRPLMEGLNLDPLNTIGRADSLACGAVAIHPDHPDRVYVGSGEALMLTNNFLGVGPMVSDDGGNRVWRVSYNK